MGAIKLADEIRDRESAKQERFRKQAEQKQYQKDNDMHAVLRKNASEPGGFKRVLPTVTKQESHDPNGFLLKMFCASRNDVKLGGGPGGKPERPASARIGSRPTGKDCHPMAAIEAAYYHEQDRRAGRKAGKRPSSAPSSRAQSSIAGPSSGRRKVYQGRNKMANKNNGRPASAMNHLARSLREDASRRAVPYAEENLSGVDWADPELTPEYVVDTMLSVGDAHSSNQALTVSEMRSYLRNTIFAEVVKFLESNDLKDFKMYDLNHDGELGKNELIKAVSIFLDHHRDREGSVASSSQHSKASSTRERPQSAADKIRQYQCSYQSRVPNPFNDQAKELWREQQAQAKQAKVVCEPKAGEAEESLDQMDDFEARLRAEGHADWNDSDEEEFDIVLGMDEATMLLFIANFSLLFNNCCPLFCLTDPCWHQASESGHYNETIAGGINSERSTPMPVAWDGGSESDSSHLGFPEDKQIKNSMLPPAQYEMAAGKVMEIPSLHGSPRPIVNA